ncbi:hypothetical protein LSTR_LSTR010015 [Laodelphax striatellus]|uniref:Uncharacterized protein n=1 Tax=Laodelphax striatellus TaxID=195883 RepID=A0A482WQ99_LAOST|nr:hypothetical protein LSTR_LSTR010015 [Laodelphax striatellus]
MIYKISVFMVLILFTSLSCVTSFKMSNEIRRPKIPSYIHICNKDDPLVDECIWGSIESLKPYLKRGIPELGIPSCEPLYIPEIVINQGKGAVSIQSTYTDIQVYGPSNFTLKAVRVDMDKDQIGLKIHIPKLRMTSTYTIRGRILMLPIHGTGPSDGNYTDIEASALIQGAKFEKGGKTYFSVTDIFVDFIIGHASVYMGDLFNGDKELSDSMNLFLNDNWRNVAKEVKPILEETMGEMFKTFANKIFHKFPLDELLPCSSGSRNCWE